MKTTVPAMILTAAFVTACDAAEREPSAEAERARVIVAENDVRQIEGALQMYRLDNNRYPSEADGLEVLVTGADGSRPVLSELRTDPWGTPYQYRNPGTRGDVDVFSYGRDGAPGGEGFDADIGNWE